MTVPLFQVDAFSAKPFAGNPAAICLLEEPADPAWMQSVAVEMNLSETAFLYPEAGDYQLRWFTPKFEVDLCGHATLASAHVLYETGRVDSEAEIRFHTRSGVLKAARRDQFIELHFPITAATECPADPGLLEALGVSASFVGRNDYDTLVEVDSEQTLRSLRPDFRALGEIDVRGVIVTARGASGEFDFVSRFFAPAAGVDEDPVTGSAHCTLVAHWNRRLGERPFVAFQASPRGGVVHVRSESDRAILGGHAVTVLKGEVVADK